MTSNISVDELDGVDREILTVLRHEGRITYQELGRAVRLSANAVAERVRRMRRSGVIKGYRAELDLAALGRPLVMVSDVRLRDGTSGAEFERGLVEFPQIFSAAHVTGEYDYQLRVACTDTSEFEDLVERLKRDHGVRELRSRLVLRQIPLDPARVLEMP